MTTVPGRKRAQLRVDDVSVLAETPQGPTVVGGIALAADDDGLTVIGPDPASQRVLPWRALAGFVCQEPTTLPDGEPATILEVGLAQGRTLKFLLPVGQVPPSETIVLETELAALASQFGGGPALTVVNADGDLRSAAAPLGPVAAPAPAPAAPVVAAAVAAPEPAADVAPVTVEAAAPAGPVNGVAHPAPVPAPAATAPSTAAAAVRTSSVPVQHVSSAVPAEPVVAVHHVPSPAPAVAASPPPAAAPLAEASVTASRPPRLRLRSRQDDNRLSVEAKMMMMMVAMLLSVDAFLFVYVTHKPATPTTPTTPAASVPATTHTGSQGSTQSGR